MNSSDYKDYSKSPYSNKSFKDMAAEEQAQAEAHFICLLALVQADMYHIDLEKLKLNNFSKKDLSALSGLEKINFNKDCFNYLTELRLLQNERALVTIDEYLPEKLNALNNKVDDVIESLKEDGNLKLEEVSNTEDLREYDFELSD